MSKVYMPVNWDLKVALLEIFLKNIFHWEKMWLFIGRIVMLWYQAEDFAYLHDAAMANRVLNF